MNQWAKRCCAIVFLSFLAYCIGSGRSHGGEWVSTPAWTGDSYMDSLYSTGAHRLHEINISGYGVSAAILDTPFDVSHPAISGQIIGGASIGVSMNGLVDGKNYYRWSSAPGMQDGFLYYSFGMDAVALPGTTDYSLQEYSGLSYDALASRFWRISHGTHVAGTVAAMAPGAGLILANAASWTEADGSLRQAGNVAQFGYEPIMAVFEYLANNADRYNIVAMNNSWGDTNFEENGVRDPRQQQLLTNLAAAGIVPVFASGNDGVNQIGSPSNYDSVLPVGASRPDGLVVEFSNQPLGDNPKKNVFLMAPGADIGSSIPYLLPRYDKMDGTSMAAPHITGALALLASGARNASMDEVLDAVFESADVLSYNGAAMLTPDQASYSGVDDWHWDVLEDIEGENSNPVNDPVQLNLTSLDPDISRSADEWREVTRLVSMMNFIWNNVPGAAGDPDVVAANMIELLENDEEENDLFPDYGALGQADFLFLRVDNAYMQLTENRISKQAEGVAGYNGTAASMLGAFANELGANLGYESSQIFQRLDAQTPGTLAAVGRQMSPNWLSSSLEYGQLGLVGIHRSLGRHNEVQRYGRTLSGTVAGTAAPAVRSGDALANVSSACGNSAAFWVQGFGSFADRSGTGEHSDYDGSFAGTLFGMEKSFGEATVGAFGSWARFRASGGDGLSKGDWYGLGLYGHAERDGFFAEASVAFNHADYESERAIFIPGAIFTTPYPDVFINLPGMDAGARSDNIANGISARLAGGREFEFGDGWLFGPRMEGSFVYSHVPSFTERGTGALALGVNSFNQSYAEGGLGFGVTKITALADGRQLIGSVKATGLYGGSFGNKLHGHFLNNGSAFTADPDRYSGMWLVPEAALTLRLNDRVDIGASYSGRFGKRYTENTGSLRLTVSF